MEDHIWMLVVVIGVVALMQLASIARSLASISASVAVTAAMTKRLLAHQGVEWDTEAEPSERVKALALEASTYVAAIKAYREQTGLGLREAKAVVDRWSRSQRGAV